MSEQIEKPCKRLIKELLKDADGLEAIMACTFTPDGAVRAHGAGLISQAPEMALFGIARMLHALLGGELPESVRNGSLTIEFKSIDKIGFTATGAADSDPRVVLHLISRTLLEMAQIIATAENVMPDPEAAQ